MIEKYKYAETREKRIRGAEMFFDSKKSIALFMITLILAIPIYTSTVMGSSLEIRKISGADGVGNSTIGVRRYDDNLTIVVDAALDNNRNLSKDNVKVRRDQSSVTYSFNYCDYFSSVYRCYFQLTDSKLSGRHAYTVYLYDPAYSLTSPVRVDNAVSVTDRLPPNAVSLDITPSYNTEPKFNISFVATDIADENVVGCAGVKKVELLEGDLTGSVIKTKEYDSLNCRESGIIEYAPSKEKKYTLCLRVTDQLGQVSNQLVCDTFEYNRTDPYLDNKTINFRSIAFKDTSGNVINTFSQKFTDVIVEAVVTGENISVNSMHADFSSLNPSLNYSSVYPYTYTTGDKRYTFKWKISLFTDRDRTALTHLYVDDTMGKSYSADKQVMLNYSGERPVPVIESLDIKTIHGAKQYGDFNYTVQGDMLSVTAIVIDNFSVSAVGDFSEMISDLDPLSGACNFSGVIGGASTLKRYKCTWATPEITAEGPTTAYATFTFSNEKQGKATAEEPVEIYSLLPNGTDLWSSTVNCMPAEIDRQIAPLTDIRVYCEVPLVPNQEGVSVATISLVGCEYPDAAADEEDNSTTTPNYIVGEKLLNSQYGSTDPFIAFGLRSADYKSVTSLTKICTLQISSVVDSAGSMYVTSEAELEEVPITLTFYNMPLGELGSSVNAKIEEVKNSAIVSFEFINTLSKILNIAEGICKLISMWNSIIQLLITGEKMLVSWGSNPLGAAALQSWKINQQTAAESKSGFTKIAYKFCAWVGCDKTLWGGWYSNLQQQMNVKTGLADVNRQTGLGITAWPASPKESLVLSIATGCLPGVISNLQKWRQIQCNYGVCLKESAKNNLPLKVCDDQRGYLECKYIFGEIFQLVPFAHFVKRMLGKLTEMLTNPLKLIFGASSFLCKIYVPGTDAGTTSLHIICNTQATVIELSNVLAQLQSLFKDFGSLFKPKNDMCEQLLNDENGENKDSGGLF